MLELLADLVEASLALDSPSLRDAWTQAHSRVLRGWPAAARSGSAPGAASSGGATAAGVYVAEPEAGQPAEPRRDEVSYWTWPRRLARAREAGESAADVLAGVQQRVLPSPPLPGRLGDKRVFAIARARAGVAVSGYHVGPFRDVRHLVVSPATGNLCAASIFQGFASQNEAEEYMRAAAGRTPGRIPVELQTGRP